MVVSTRRMSARARYTFALPTEVQLLIWSWYVTRLRVRLFLHTFRQETRPSFKDGFNFLYIPTTNALRTLNDGRRWLKEKNSLSDGMQGFNEQFATVYRGLNAEYHDPYDVARAWAAESQQFWTLYGDAREPIVDAHRFVQYFEEHDDDTWGYRNEYLRIPGVEIEFDCGLQDFDLRAEDDVTPLYDDALALLES